ncbi:hypothetical protein FH972_024268 [Carpinus fangiana]|uniref:C2H2-type domain-containing protein n=1 Tax=Carpinus fangiana TaxID=176857 RepID=A0A5N6KYE7_9ROSI|nr:hypothetical protein FH972_024268 [Carpinus fangiana]
MSWTPDASFDTSWYNDSQQQSPDTMANQQYLASFADSSQNFGHSQFSGASIYDSSQESMDRGYQSPTGDVNAVMADPVVQQSLGRAEPWNPLGNTRPGGVEVTPQNYYGFAQQYVSSPSQAQSHASGSFFDQGSVSTHTVPEDHSVHSVDLTSERQYRKPVSPTKSKSRGARSRASSTVSARTSTSTKRKAEDGERGLACHECSFNARTESELKKHDLKHNKPHWCDVPGCTWTKGFPTPNDVWRHKASKHQLYQPGAKIYLCAAPNCLEKTAVDKDKYWPRLDNFRQHIERMHCEQDVNELGLPPHLQQSYSLKETDRGIIIAYNPRNPQIHQSVSTAGAPETMAPPAYPRRISTGAQYLSPPEARRAPGSRSARNKSNMSVASAPARAPQAPPPIIVHQPTDSVATIKEASSAEERLKSMSEAIVNSYKDQSMSQQELIFKTLQLVQNNKTGDVTSLFIGSEQDAEGDAVMGDLSADTETQGSSSESPELAEARGKLRQPLTPPTTGGVRCDVCNKDLKRECDLRLLVGEHQQAPCAHLYHEEGRFREHLKRKHGTVGQEAIDKQVGLGRIGHNGVGSFWCGFAGCQKVVRCAEKHTKAWDERFDHIGKHLAEEKQSMNDWLPPRGLKTKGQIEQESKNGIESPACEEDIESDDESSPQAANTGDADSVDPSQLVKHSGESHASSASHSHVNGFLPQHHAGQASLPPANTAATTTARPNGDRPSHDHPASIDIVGLDAAVVALRRDVDAIRGSLAMLQQAVAQQQPPPPDLRSLDVLSDTVSAVSAKAGEVDGLRFQVEILKQRIKALEESPADANNSNTLAPITNMSPASHPPHLQSQSQPSPTPIPVTSGGWNAVNSLTKRKSSADLNDSAKRLRPYEGTSLPPLSHAISGPTDAFQPQQRSEYIATQDDYSQDSWRPKAYSPTSRGGGRGRGRGPGRPRKDAPTEYGTPQWEAETWTGPSGVDTDGYYHYSSPSGDRGRLIRRGTGGATVVEETGRRTRQKPTRNAEGILIRKDGKPDQRSISSAMNLKKVHARKMAELDASGLGSSHDGNSMTGSPATGNDHRSVSSDEAYDVEEKRASPAPRRSASASLHKDPHDRVMQQMFPKGLGEDAERANHAAHIFAPTQPSQRVQPRGEMVKEDNAATTTVENPTQDTQPRVADSQQTIASTTEASVLSESRIEG